MKKKNRKFFCPHCSVRISNWEDLYVGKSYVCGNAKCKKGFMFLKSVSEIDLDFMSF